MRRPLPVRRPAPPALSPDEKQYRHLNTKADILCNLARGHRAMGDNELAEANEAEAARLRAEAKEVIRPFVERETEAARLARRPSPIAARLAAYSR
ncbi:MAG TPA: hypothetical protein VEC60_15720 [Reyranella sp.]|nr:hypothetical protein [Reyranella sp.]